MKNIKKILFINSSAFLLSILSVSKVHAYAFISTWGAGSKPAGVPTDIRAAIMNITNWILGFVVMIATLIVIYGGILYLTAMGNDEQTAKARSTIASGIIGIVICGLAYALVIVVSTVILQP
jgi:hypothetical protein